MGARIELYMDDELVRGMSYKSKPIRRDILSKWEVLIRNQYERHVFWIKIIPK
jgi:hypothetical protein